MGRCGSIIAASLLFLVLPGVLGSAQAQGPALRPTSSSSPQSAHRCRGSTRTGVPITWPSDADRAVNARLHWSKTIPWRVRRWAYLVVPAARSTGLDPYLVAAVIRAESSGDPRAWQLDSDAHGLMQVLHASFEPAANIRRGTAMLAGFIREFHSRDLGLAAYNAGPGAVEQYGGVPPFIETRSYVLMVGYWRDQFAGLPITPARTARFNAAAREVEAYYKRLCGR